MHLFEDRGERDTPDSVFPNNWFSTHPGGHVAIYPMYSPSRRRERRADVIEMLKAEYRVQDVIDYSGLEHDGLFLEGTGAMVFDHLARVAYTARSNRADPVALERFSTHFNFEPMVFDTADAAGPPDLSHQRADVRGDRVRAWSGFEMIPDAARAAEVRARLEESGRQVIALSATQIARVRRQCDRAVGPRRAHPRAVAACRREPERRAEGGHREAPRAWCRWRCRPIEMAGGSVRCMIAGIHLVSQGRVIALPAHDRHLAVVGSDVEEREQFLAEEGGIRFAAERPHEHGGLRHPEGTDGHGDALDATRIHDAAGGLD